MQLQDWVGKYFAWNKKKMGEIEQIMNLKDIFLYIR